MGLDPDRLGVLNKNRTSALAASIDSSFPADPDNERTTALAEMVGIHDGHGRGFVLVLEPGPKAFGLVLLWADRFELEDLTLMVDPTALPGDHARRATALAVSPVVLEVDGTDLVDIVAAPLPVTVVEADSSVANGVKMLRSADLDVVFDDGIVTGEYLGLEVARVVPTADGGELQAGVGAVDREANRVLHGGASPWDALVRVIAEVSTYRRPGESFHPLSQMARERWMLHSLIDDPSRVGIEALDAVSSVESRLGLRSAEPVAAVGETEGGRILVVAGAGTDVNLLGVTADLISREMPDRVVLVPCSALLPQLNRAAQRLSVPVSVVDVAPPWTA